MPMGCVETICLHIDGWYIPLREHVHRPVQSSGLCTCTGEHSISAPSTSQKHYLKCLGLCVWYMTLEWRPNGRESVANHQPHDCLLNRLLRRRSKKTSKLRVTGLCAGNSPGTGEFPAQMASNVENVTIWWCHHATNKNWYIDISVSAVTSPHSITINSERAPIIFTVHGTDCKIAPVY